MTPAIIAGDTGPLLHIGLHGNPMIRRVIAQMSGRLVLPNAVLQELVDWSHNPVVPQLQTAALTVLAQGSMLFQHDTAIYRRKNLESVRREVEAEDAKRRLGHVGGHDGEIEAILYAKAHGAIVLTNDISARTVASKPHNLEVASFTTVLAVEVQAGRMDGGDAAQMCALYEEISWPGAHNTSAVSFATAHVPPGFTT